MDQKIATATISPHPDNPRASVGDIRELVASVLVLGVLQPIVVAPGSKGKYAGKCTVCALEIPRLASGVLDAHDCPGGQWPAADEYHVVMGHRRLAAAREARLETVPVIVRADLADRSKALAVMLVENIHRQDLTAVEEARGFEQLALSGLSERQIAQTLGVQRVRVERGRKLLALPVGVQKRVASRQLTVEEALLAAKFEDQPEVRERIENAPTAADAHFEAANADLRDAEEAARKLRTVFVEQYLRASPLLNVRNGLIGAALRLFITGKSTRVSFSGEPWQVALVGLQTFYEGRVDKTDWLHILASLGYEWSSFERTQLQKGGVKRAD